MDSWDGEMSRFAECAVREALAILGQELAPRESEEVHVDLYDLPSNSLILFRFREMDTTSSARVAAALSIVAQACVDGQLDLVQKDTEKDDGEER